MVADPGVLLAALVCAGIGVGALLVVTGLRGVLVQPGRPQTRLSRTVQALRSPALSGRIGAGVVAGALTLVLTHWPVAAVGLAALVVSWPALFGGGRLEQTQIARLEALVVWTESLRDTISAHASLERAIPASTQHAPPLIRPALIRLAGQIRVRTPLDLALQALAVDLDDPSADHVIAALVLNVRRRGDQLEHVLTGLAATAREELNMRRKVSAGRAGLRRGVQLVVLLTLAVAGYLSLFSRAYVRPYATVPGQIALTVVLALFATGFVWMRRLAAGRQVQPFLARPGFSISAADVQVVSALTGLATPRHQRPPVTGAASGLPLAGPR